MNKKNDYTQLTMDDEFKNALLEATFSAARVGQTLDAMKYVALATSEQKVESVTFELKIQAAHWNGMFAAKEEHVDEHVKITTFELEQDLVRAMLGDLNALCGTSVASDGPFVSTVEQTVLGAAQTIRQLWLQRKGDLSTVTETLQRALRFQSDLHLAQEEIIRLRSEGYGDLT